MAFANVMSEGSTISKWQWFWVPPAARRSMPWLRAMPARYFQSVGSISIGMRSFRSFVLKTPCTRMLGYLWDTRPISTRSGICVCAEYHVECGAGPEKGPFGWSGAQEDVPSAEADFVATFFYPTLPCRAFLLRPFGAGVRRSNPAQFINCEWKWIRKHRTLTGN